MTTLSKTLMLSTIAAGIVTASAISAAASPPQMPKEFLGWWCSEGGAQGVTEYTRRECRDNDGALHVTRTGYIGWETQCKVIKVRRKGFRLYSIAAKCEGEGASWRERGIWAIGHATYSMLVTPGAAAQR